MAKNRYVFPDGEVVTWGGMNTCLCSNCRKVFNSPSAFDYHQNKHLCLPGEEIPMPTNNSGYHIISAWTGLS